ncbi:hypothetical protein FO519_002360 [Halicephalobus sp. NKZ332]|nr:hypothetical protein FO519_002360 [Halicephalobus sp. NKZ332]
MLHPAREVKSLQREKRTLKCKQNLKHTSEEEEEKLQIHPVGLEGDKYVVKADRAFRIACVYNDDDMDNVHQLQWENEDGKTIDSSSSSNLFTIALHERETHHKKRSLVFSKIDSRDSGSYTCVAHVAGQTLRRTVHVHVVGNIEWKEPRDVVGAMTGESLTINCGAKGNPQPEIEMTNEDGELLNEQEYVVAENEVTIESLTKNYQNAKIRCLALQLIPEYATTSVEKHEISIDVWFRPEFDADEINRHAILGRSANLYCNISASNPPVMHFNFLKDNVKIDDDDERYEIVEDVDNQCEVNNGKAKAHQLINLHMANPPNQVKAIISYKIEYVRSRLLDDIDSSEEEEENNGELERQEEHIWKAHGSHVIRTRSFNNLYEIHGLVQDAEYVFRFTAMNEAGAGDSIEITARTQSGKYGRNSAMSMNSLTSVTLLLGLILLLC